MQTIENIKKAVIPIAEDYGVRRVFLFGSYAKGTATEESDVDLLIEKGDKRFTLLSLSGFRLDVMDVLNIPVDVVVRLEKETEFQKRIKGSEILLYEK